jgi:hypothetical protein
MKSGEYAEPYQCKPFGSVDVVDRVTGEMVPCNPDICPKAEPIPPKGVHGDNDRASVLQTSPLAGRLINRAPFYWSGGLGTLIRKSSEPIRKDIMWDFFVFTNSPEASVYDVAHYPSWLDSWRFSQVDPGTNYADGGWSKQAYIEHRAIQEWGLSSKVNGAFNLRLPGVAKYTRDVMGQEIIKLIDDEITLDEFIVKVSTGWEEINKQQGKLHQLKTYRASLGLDALTEVDLCRLHRDLMDQNDPNTCLKYDPSETNDATVPAVLATASVVVISLILFIMYDRRRRDHKSDKDDTDEERDEIQEVQKLTRRDNLNVQIARILLVATMGVSGAALTAELHMVFLGNNQYEPVVSRDLSPRKSRFSNNML